MDDLIYNQTKIPKEKWRYGLRSSARVGCGWIATYNALRRMGHEAVPEELIRYYKRQLPLIHGNMGTMFWGPALYFRKHGFGVTVTNKRKKYDALAKASNVCILYYHWRHKWKLGGHFVTFEHTPDGYIGYNTYSNSTGPDRWGNSLTEFLKKRRYFCTFLIGIRNKKSPEGQKEA